MKKIMTNVMCGVMLFVMIFGMGITGGCAKEVPKEKYIDGKPIPRKYYDYEIQFNGAYVGYNAYRYELSDKVKNTTTYGAWYKEPDGKPEWATSGSWWEKLIVTDEWLLDTTSPESYTYVITNQDECNEYFDKIKPIDFDKKMLILHFFTDKVNVQYEGYSLEKLVKDKENNLTIGICLRPRFEDSKEVYEKPRVQYCIVIMDQTDYKNISFEIYHKNFRGEDI